jgi:transitional endoplasmic reticulum ATPase
MTLRRFTAEGRPQDAGRGIVRVDPADLAALGLHIGDVVWVLGTRRTVARVMPAFKDQRGQEHAAMDGTTRENAGVAVGEPVQLDFCQAQAARTVQVAPAGSQVTPQDLAAVGQAVDGLAVVEGDRLRLALFGGRRVDLVVRATEPGGPVLLGPTTQLVLEKAATTAAPSRSTGPSWEDIGGLGSQLRRIREIVELPLRRPELFEHLGIDPPKGVLLHGPPGTGKTLIARTIAREAGASFFLISGPEVIQKHYGESEARLRKIFEEASKRGPSVVFIDEIDSLAPKRTSVQGEVEKRVVATLLALMDGLERRSRVVVLAATNLPDNLDPALRRPGRFDREIEVPIPDRPGRAQILAIHSRGMPLGDDVDLARIAGITHGFVGADLEALCREAAMACLREVAEATPGGLLLARPVDPRSLVVRQRHFDTAMSEVSPSALREVYVEVPEVRWSDVGGLDGVRQTLIETLEWPLTHPELFQAARVRPPKGILLYGPPGTGKTMLAKAVATETGANFLAVQGPELMSRYVGDAEAALREVFRKARQAAPCVLFFDEIDGLLPSREARSDNAVAERVLAQFLVEMDGIEDLRGVLVLAATNRLDRLDPAVRRPGRFDVLVPIEVPDAAGREAILRVHLRDRPLSDTVDIKALAAEAEGFSGAELAAVVEGAARAAVRRAVREGGSPVLTRELLEAELAAVAVREAA